MNLADAWTYCEKMLPRVSRTFALNIGRLEGVLYRAVLIGYLLFRIADTLEDSAVLTEDEKGDALESFARIFDTGTFPPFLKGRGGRVLSRKVAPDTPEGDLLANSSNVFLCYRALPENYQTIMGQALIEAARGMAMYQKRKHNDPRAIFQLKDNSDLEQYCYYVAGIVGVMLTRFFCIEPALAPLKTRLEKYQVAFGLCLQLTNIAKDYPKDLERGWCYLPKTITDKLGITPSDLLICPSLKRPEITELMIKKTLPYLEEAIRYIAEIPTGMLPVRMFCVIPLTLAYHTLAYLRQTGRTKLPRERVQKILALSETFCLSNAALKTDYEHTLRHAPLTY